MQRKNLAPILKATLPGVILSVALAVPVGATSRADLGAYLLGLILGLVVGAILFVISRPVLLRLRRTHSSQGRLFLASFAVLTLGVVAVSLIVPQLAPSGQVFSMGFGGVVGLLAWLLGMRRWLDPSHELTGRTRQQ